MTGGNAFPPLFALHAGVGHRLPPPTPPNGEHRETWRKIPHGKCGIPFGYCESRDTCSGGG